MSDRIEKLVRLSARLDEDTQEKAEYLLGLGYGPTELVKEGIDLLYQHAKNAKAPSIPALLEMLSVSGVTGPSDLSANHKKYYKELLIEKHIG